VLAAVEMHDDARPWGVRCPWRREWRPAPGQVVFPQNL